MTSRPSNEDALFQAAAQLSGTERSAFLDAGCAGDPALRRRLEALARTRLQAATTGARFEELALLAWAESRLGRSSEATALAERVRHSKFRHPAYAEILKPLVRGADAVQIKPDN